jgi:CDP-4-dehydro-6-deoxyglucose reductase, E3
MVLLCQARALSALVVEARRIASVDSVEIKTLPCRIERLSRLAPDVMQVFLRLPAVERLAFQAGQYLDVLLDDGRRRSFSIASPPHDAEPLELHVRHVPGGGFTERLFGTMGAGTLLRIEGPIGQFVYEDDARPALFIAGGTGFAPIKSMLRHLLERRGGVREMHLRARGRARRASAARWARGLRGGPAGHDRGDPRSLSTARPSRRTAALRFVRLRARVTRSGRQFADHVTNS